MRTCRHGGEPLYACEHPDVAVPQSLVRTLERHGWEDTSWHNDAVSSFTHDGLRLLLTVAQEDPNKREMSGPRFWLGVAPPSAVSDGEPADWSKYVELWSGEDPFTARHAVGVVSVLMGMVGRLSNG